MKEADDTNSWQRSGNVECSRTAGWKFKCSHLSISVTHLQEAEQRLPAWVEELFPKLCVQENWKKYPKSKNKTVFTPMHGAVLLSLESIAPKKYTRRGGPYAVRLHLSMLGLRGEKSWRASGDSGLWLWILHRSGRVWHCIPGVMSLAF